MGAPKSPEEVTTCGVPACGVPACDVPSGEAGVLGTNGGWGTRLRRCSIGLIMSDPYSAKLSWVGAERIAISGLPARHSVPGLAEQGVTHVVNCRARPQVRMSGDLSAERAAFPGRVMHAPMWDLGQRQRPRLWAAAAAFAARALAEDPQARVLIHCQWGKRRSAMLAYAVLRLRGHAQESAAALVLTHRPQAELVPNYVRSVERWLESHVQCRDDRVGHGLRDVPSGGAPETRTLPMEIPAHA